MSSGIWDKMSGMIDVDYDQGLLDEICWVKSHVYDYEQCSKTLNGIWLVEIH